VPSQVGLWKQWHLPHAACALSCGRSGGGHRWRRGDPGAVRTGRLDPQGGRGDWEYLEYTNLDVWFGQATPWTPPARMPELR